MPAPHIGAPATIMQTKHIKISADIKRKQHSWLKKERKITGISQSEQVRRALGEYIEKRADNKS